MDFLLQTHHFSPFGRPVNPTTLVNFKIGLLLFLLGGEPVKDEGTQGRRLSSTREG